MTNGEARTEAIPPPCQDTPKQERIWRGEYSRKPNETRINDMWIEGKLTRDGKFWMVDFPGLDAFTQGRTKKEAYEMAKDLLEGLAEVEGFDLDITVIPGEGDMFRAGAVDTKGFTAFILRRWRKAHDLTLQETAKRLGSTSINTYARYEQGRSEPTISMMQRLIQAISPGEPLRLVFGS